MELTLRAGAMESLDAFVHPNAIFLAERLFAEFRSLENLAFLAKVHMHAGDASTAYLLLQSFYPFQDALPATSASPIPTPPTGPAARRGLKKNIPVNTPLWQCVYQYGVAQAKTGRWPDAEATMELLNPSTNANVAYWCGVASRRLQRTTFPEYFVWSVTANPMMFASFEMAAKVKPSACVDPYPVERSRSPSPRSAHVDNSTATHHAASTSQAPPTRARVNSGARASAPGATATLQRRSSQERMSTAPLAPLQPPVPITRQDRSDRDVMRLLHSHADVTLKLWSYDTKGCLATLLNDRVLQRKTGWHLEMTALAHFHSGDIANATKAFGAMLDAEPWRLNREAIVFYSTCLWHQKRDAQLGALAQRMIALHPNSAYTMCVIGNCYSLARNAASAYAMFERATQIDPSFAYAHTLRGHEALALDRLPDAETHFREALLHDPRHFSALAGLGDLFIRRDEVPLARSNLRQAMTINELPAIVNRLASTFHAVGYSNDADLRTALTLYDRVLDRHPRNFAAVHQRATVLLRLGAVEDALESLEGLLEDCGDEAAIHITVGHCLARLGRTARAVEAYRRAADLDPRRAQMVKSCIDRLGAEAQN
jgi:tetratricopeptide (TPR) repeat protein